jgi:RNA polymerase sigma-70 factor (ECF subfamily)
MPKFPTSPPPPAARSTASDAAAPSAGFRRTLKERAPSRTQEEQEEDCCVVDDERRDRYEALVRAVVEPLRRYAARRTDPATAEEVVADALLVMWRRLDEVPAGAELPWCYGVARRCLANEERTVRRQRQLYERIARLDPPHPIAPIDDALPDPALAHALAALPPDDQELLRLWAWEELAPREIAAALGVSPNAVSIRLYRARRRLAAALGASERKTGARAGHTTSKGTETTT